MPLLCPEKPIFLLKESYFYRKISVNSKKMLIQQADFNGY